MLSAKYEANYSLLTMHCLLVFLSSLLSIIPAQEYVINIERRVTTYNNTASTWIVQPDSFDIPICENDDAAQCRSMGGEQSDKSCKCECSSKRNGVFYKSTFGFYDNEWKCEENTRVRSEHKDCSTTTLNDRQLNISLITLPAKSSSVSDLFLSANLTIKCGLYPKAGSYLKCNGFWWEINHTLVRSRFSTTYRDDRLYLNYNYQPSSSFINGRVIKLRIDCFDETSNVPSSEHCVLLKVEGQLTCPVPVTQPTTKQPFLESTSSLPSLQSTTPTISKPTSTISKPTSAQVTKTQSVSNGTSTINMTSVPNKENDKTGGNTADHSGVIAGSLAGVIVLMIVIIAIVTTKRRKKKRSEAKTTNTAIENGTYERGVDNSLSLSHCELQSSVGNHGYGTIEALDVRASPPSSDAPIYNTLEAPEYEKPDIRSKKEPLYNVLGDPDNGPNKEPPCYDVLEGPFPNDTAAYDKLQRPFEAPNSREVPAYRALEGHDPHVYGTLTTSNQANRPAEDNTELDGAAYDCVGDMIMRELPQSTNIYHQLNQHGQQNTNGQNQSPRDQDTSHSQA